MFFVCLFFCSDLDLKLSPTGKVVKVLGDTLSIIMEKTALGETKVSWTKVMALVRFYGSKKWQQVLKESDCLAFITTVALRCLFLPPLCLYHILNLYLTV